MTNIENFGCYNVLLYHQLQNQLVPEQKRGYCRCLIAHNAHFRALFTKNDIYALLMPNSSEEGAQEGLYFTGVKIKSLFYE